MKDTLEVLRWARKTALEDEIVDMFWSKLCKAVREPKTASAGRVISEIGAYGGNTIVNVFRTSGGRSYDKVAYDVAKTFQPRAVPRQFSRKNTESCERFVLRVMGVRESELSDLRDALKAKRVSSIVKTQRNGAAKEVAKATARSAATQAAKMVAAAAAKRALTRTAEESTKLVARQVFLQTIRALSAILLVWGVVDVAGPAKRVTIPAVTWVALLRKLHAGVKND